MKRTVTGGFMMKGGIEDPRPLTTLERINAILELAYTLQGPKQDENNKLMGNNMEAKALAELVDFVNSDEQHRARRPFDRDDAAILQAARAIFPNAVFVESEMSLIDRVHMVHGEAPEPRTVNTLQGLADTQERQFNRRYYGNKKGLPYFERTNR